MGYKKKINKGLQNFNFFLSMTEKRLNTKDLSVER